VSFYTLGCRLNQAETAMMAERFRQRGYRVVEHGQPADVAVIHTCSVTDHADARCRQEIRKVRRRNPAAIVCAVGCYVQAEPEAVARIDAVDLIVGNDRKYELAMLVEQVREGEAPACPERSVRAEPPSLGVTGDAAREPLLRPWGEGPWVVVNRRVEADALEFPLVGYYPHQTRANIKIQDGCDFCCAFCILPRIRGQARSRRLGDIIAEGHELVRRGHKELVVTGVNVGTYHFEEYTIADIAWRLSDIPGVERVRISSIEPSTVSDELLDWMATSDRACRHLHLPLQSGDDEVLARMKRVYTAADYARFVERVKSRMPDLGLGADIMVGFPGETDVRFENSRRFVAEMPFSYLHIFSYSDRLRTAANSYPDKCRPETIRERSAAMHALAGEKKRAFFREHLGQTVDVLFETVDADGLRKGFSGNYLRVGLPPGQAADNQLLAVRVTELADDHCLGAVCPTN
jgi:threonylcarbamoyladenosine tRNA methylthiotransferase MtaB